LIRKHKLTIDGLFGFAY